MKKKCSQLKDAARAALLGHYSVLIAASVLLEVAFILFNIPFSRMAGAGVQYMVPSRIILGYAGSLVVSLIASIFSDGITYMHLKAARKQTVGFSDFLFCVKNRPDRYLGCGLIFLLIFIALTLPGMICMITAAFLAQQGAANAMALTITALLLYIAGLIVYIVLILGLSQVICLLLDDPDLTVGRAVRSSFRCMRGNKWRLFVLCLSFLGWALLGLITLGVGFLWIQHYLIQSGVQFYLDVTGQSAGQPENQ